MLKTTLSRLRSRGLKTFLLRLIKKLRVQYYYFQEFKAPPKEIHLKSRSSSSAFKILFYSEMLDENKTGIRYRVTNLQERLGLVGIKSEHIDSIKESKTWDFILKHDAIVVYRSFLTPTVKSLLSFSKKVGIATVYSIDDLVFGPNLNKEISFLKGRDEEEIRDFGQAVEEYERAIKEFDFLLVTTEGLKKAGEILGKKTFVVKNGFSLAQMQISEKALRDKNAAAPKTDLILGYFSGTNTHDKDFSLITPQLLKIMEALPFVKLKIVGPLALGNEFNRFEERVLKKDYVDWRYLPYEIAEVDINLAPLEVNSFTNAKTELKYFEAGLLKVPTIATPTKPFLEAIEHGKNGLLASSSLDWLNNISELVGNKDLRLAMGKAAHKDTISNYSPISQAETTKKVFQDIIKNYKSEN